MSPKSYYYARPNDLLREVFGRYKSKKRVEMKDVMRQNWFREVLRSELGELIMQELNNVLESNNVNWDMVVKGYIEITKCEVDNKSKIVALEHLERLVRENESTQKRKDFYSKDELPAYQKPKEIESKENKKLAIAEFDTAEVDEYVSYQNQLIDEDLK